MTEAFIQKHLAARQARARLFVAHPERFKVCCGCSSIHEKRVGICGLCGVYRFESEPETVVRVAHEIAAVPFPRTAGAVPRLF